MPIPQFQLASIIEAARLGRLGSSSDVVHTVAYSAAPEFISLSPEDIFLRKRPDPSDPDTPLLINPWQDEYQILPGTHSIDGLF